MRYAIGGLVLAAIAAGAWLWWQPPVSPPAQSNPLVIAAPGQPSEPAGKRRELQDGTTKDFFAREGYGDDGTETAPGDPRFKSFNDAQGRLVRTLRIDNHGRIVAETRYKDGQSLEVRRTYTEGGRLWQEMRLRNGVVLQVEDFR